VGIMKAAVGDTEAKPRRIIVSDLMELLKIK
jgi:hypothetical protein